MHATQRVLCCTAHLWKMWSPSLLQPRALLVKILLAHYPSDSMGCQAHGLCSAEHQEMR